VKRPIVVAVLTGAVALLLITGAWIVVVVNPFEWGAKHSSQFSWDKFKDIRVGQSMADVIDILGDPIASPTIYESLSGNGYTRVCSEIGRCTQYQFAGIQLIGGREAIVITDTRTNRVIGKRINYEP
jgi:hypothetical protein